MGVMSFLTKVYRVVNIAFSPPNELHVTLREEDSEVILTFPGGTLVHIGDQYVGEFRLQIPS